MPVIDANDLSVHYRSRDVRSRTLALNGVTFQVQVGDFLGVVGEAGSGKSTLAATVALRAGRGDPEIGYPEIFGGSLSVLGAKARNINRFRRARTQFHIGYLAQDGAERLDARLTCAENVAEPIYSRDRKFSSREAGTAVATLIDSMRLPLSVMHKYPHELSSGQRQRIALARALVLEPALLVADEPTRGVDVTVREEVLDVIRDLRTQREFSALIVSSDLKVAAGLTDRVLVLQRSMVIGDGTVEEVLRDPRHPYLMDLARIARSAQ
ncbi:ATP-binding cassette domain-containing protein [Cryobacterium sp. BB307]|uniref:ATP-binding cassette domain-containing protein n=1 Tax=Cryobacterium sp. BB307 TaxID=2716317 RepID=UPI001B2FE8A1|nr:ATP-binding cassette domain-containing protein [Cryobacterium sp. BB307]